MTWFDREENYDYRKHSDNLWRYIPKKLLHAVEDVAIDSDGYWIWLAPGYTAYDGGSDCMAIHDYTIAEVRKAIKTIRKMEDSEK